MKVKPMLATLINEEIVEGEGKLRHPRFLGLRKDKSARSIRRKKS